jgi:hypothetical protein
LDNVDSTLEQNIRVQQQRHSANHGSGTTGSATKKRKYDDSMVNVNFGGECVTIERDVVCDPHIQPNLLSALFHPRWERVLPRDKHGNIYLELDYSWVKPILDAYEIAHHVGVSKSITPFLSSFWIVKMLIQPVNSISQFYKRHFPSVNQILSSHLTMQKINFSTC